MMNVPVPADVTTDGFSLLPQLLGGKAPVRRNWLLLGRAQTVGETTERAGIYEPPERAVQNRDVAEISDFTGIVGHRWKFIRYTRTHHEELYDLRNDPFELNNLLAQGEARFAGTSRSRAQLLQHLHTTLRKLSACHGANCSLR